MGAFYDLCINGKRGYSRRVHLMHTKQQLRSVEMGELHAERDCVPAPGSASLLAQQRRLTNLDPDDYKASERDMLTNINYTRHHKIANISGPEFSTHCHFQKCIKWIPVNQGL